ncbi:MAG: hypothetical protein ACT6S0_25870 [Roseateles sp.]|uniref:hypothetical protein n=1 Tax=Roseateles sp. TaxID=1971397 RepID=UPI00403711C7
MIKHFRFLGALALTFAMLSPAAVLACSPIKVFYVYFDRDSATVAADQTLKLRVWMQELRARYANHEAIYIGASVNPEERDHDPKGLGLERARNVARVLKEDLHFSARVALPRSSYVADPGSLASGAAEDPRVLGVQLDFLPACPHECTCQLGDPLHTPPATR